MSEKRKAQMKVDDGCFWDEVTWSLAETLRVPCHCCKGNPNNKRVCSMAVQAFKLEPNFRAFSSFDVCVIILAFGKCRWQGIIRKKTHKKPRQNTMINRNL